MKCLSTYTFAPPSLKKITLGNQVIIYSHPSLQELQFSIFAVYGNGIPLQYSCLENPVDGGAW